VSSSAEQALEYLDYDRATGTFSSKRTQKPIKGQRLKDGTLMIKYGYMGQYRHRADRLAFAFITGELGSHDILHINQDVTDNRFSNLVDQNPNWCH
jgi:hypothetical protein